METTRAAFWERHVRRQATVLLVAQAVTLIAGLVYLFVRGADAYVVTLMGGTLYSLKPAPCDRLSVPAAVVAWLANGRSRSALPDRDLRAS